MNIRIDDDVPLPEPSKPDTWVSVSTPTTKRDDGGWVKAAYDEANKLKDSMGVPGCYIPSNAKVDQIVELHKTGYNVNKQYPLPTTYDAKGVPTVDCFLVGGPLNGKNGPIVGTAKVVELDIYSADGTVSSVELYELGDNGQLGVRHWKGTRQ